MLLPCKQSFSIDFLKIKSYLNTYQETNLISDLGNPDSLSGCSLQPARNNLIQIEILNVLIQLSLYDLYRVKVIKICCLPRQVKSLACKNRPLLFLRSKSFTLLLSSGHRFQSHMGDTYLYRQFHVTVNSKTALQYVEAEYESKEL